MISKLPCLILKNSTAVVNVTNGEIEDGHEKIIDTWTGKGQFSQSTKRVQNSEGVWVSLVGKFYTDVEITEGIEFSGNISINGSKFYNFQGRKLYNPDGTFHHLELEVNA